MNIRSYWIHRTPEFRDWYSTQTEKSRVQIDKPLDFEQASSEGIKMLKTKTFKRRKISSKITPKKASSRKLKDGMGIDSYDPTRALLDEERIGRAIWECLKNDDPEGVIEVIQIHLEAINKTQLAKHANLAKTTLYHSFRSKNPTIKTLAKLIHASF